MNESIDPEKLEEAYQEASMGAESPKVILLQCVECHTSFLLPRDASIVCQHWKPKSIPKEEITIIAEVGFFL